ncbi:MAG: winged helix-turn-helix domain-containing protein [Rickettsiaceae bacterium]|nr:winged helix-turn-helix domain-containing protein [Rickettsiaceae bacterium]
MTDKLPPKVIVIEKDDLLRTALGNTIERYWFTVLRAPDIETSLRILKVNKPNLAVLSIKNLGISALDAINQLRSVEACANLPVILIMDENTPLESIKSVESLELEVVYRPYTPNDIMISIKNLLRKSKPVFQDKVVKHKDLSMDLATFKVTRGAKNIHLGPTEFKILQLLAQSPRTIFSRQQIVDYVWGVDQRVETRTVDVHVNRLRSLIKLKDGEIPFIKTVRSSGYCLNLPGEVE